MRFISFSIDNFRNISSASIPSDAEDIVFSGINGQGKTNMLEAVYVLCYGSSFRTNHLKEAIKKDTNSFSLKSTFIDDLGIKQSLSVSFDGNRRIISIDGKELKDRRDLIYSFPCIVFSHDDISFVKGEPSERRMFFDQMMSLYSPVFFDTLRSYKAILQQRNAAIKTGNLSLLDLYDERLALYGIDIIKARAEAVYEFNSFFPELFRSISGENMDVSVRYQPSWNMENTDEILSYLQSTHERDAAMMTTSSGPHRDRFTVVSDGVPFQNVGSTGQIRLASILFRIAEARYFTLKSGKKPVLLIDDVLLELDNEKRGRVLSSLPAYSQAFYTFLPRENYFSEKKENAIFYTVEKGEYRVEGC